MKNKHQLQRVIGVCIGILGVVALILAGLCGSEGEEDVGRLFAYVGLAMAVIGCIWYLVATGNSRKVCNKCGASMAGCAYEYQERRREVSNDGKYLTVTVWISATCPSCGQPKSFEQKFTLSERSDDLQYQVDSFCRSKFGH